MIHLCNLKSSTGRLKSGAFNCQLQMFVKNKFLFLYASKFSLTDIKFLNPSCERVGFLRSFRTTKIHLLKFCVELQGQFIAHQKWSRISGVNILYKHTDWDSKIFGKHLVTSSFISTYSNTDCHLNHPGKPIRL